MNNGDDSLLLNVEESNDDWLSIPTNNNNSSVSPTTPNPVPTPIQIPSFNRSNTATTNNQSQQTTQAQAQAQIQYRCYPRLIRKVRSINDRVNHICRIIQQMNRQNRYHTNMGSNRAQRRNRMINNNNDDLMDLYL